MKRLVLTLMFAMWTVLAWALPTTAQVEQAVQRGDYAQAESMMHEVVAAKPGSAKAHYVYAEILAHNGNTALAATEAARAEQIDPAIKFTDPAKFRAFKQLVDNARHPQARTPAPNAQTPLPTPVQTPRADTGPAIAPAAAAHSMPGVPTWVWVAGLAVVGLGAWKLLSRNPPAGPGSMPNAGAPSYGGPVATGGGYGGGYGGGGYGGGYGGGVPQAPSAGGGLLRTGAAVAGGVAAGMLIDEMIHRGREGGESRAAAAGSAVQPGGFEPIDTDLDTAQLQSRQIDFGRGNDWDDGGGSSSDASSGSSDDDGGWS